MGNGNEISAQKAQLRPYVALNAGNVRFAGNMNYADLGAKLGCTLEYKNFTASAEVGAGSLVNAKVKADLNIPISQLMGIELGGSARADIALKRETETTSLSYGGKTYVFDSSTSATTNMNGNTTEYNHPLIYSYTTPAGERSVTTKYLNKNLNSELHAGLTFGNSRTKFTIGGMVADRQSLNKSYTNNINNNYDITININNQSTVAIDTNGYDTQDVVAQLSEQGVKDIKINGTQILGTLGGNTAYNISEHDNVTKTFGRPKNKIVAGGYTGFNTALNKSGSVNLGGEASLLNGKFEGEVKVSFNL